jgi:hypothetical protein
VGVGRCPREGFYLGEGVAQPEPVLVYPDYRLPFKLTTDASKTGLGAVLSQDQESGDQPVAYASKVNSPTASNYSISELECLAVMWAVRLFRPHLYGRRFTIVTDHIALKWLMTAREPAGRLHRWALTLQEYDFDIQYRPGKENHVADALSRGPAPAASGDTVNEPEQTADDPAIGVAEVRTVELAVERGAAPRTAVTADEQVVLSGDAVDTEIDSAARDVIQAATVRRVEAAEIGVVQFTDDDIKREQDRSVMVQSLKRKGAYRGQRVFSDEDGLVRAEVDEGESRIVLPAFYLALAFKEAHDSIWAGHLRGPQTLEKLQRMYWWPHMRDAVRSWLAACQDCGSRKAKPKAVVPPPRSVRTGDVGDRWAIDVAGPLPVTASGNRYVIAAVEYTTRYAVAAAVPEHTAKSIARFLMDKVVLVYGPMREVMMDGAREFGSKATAELLALMQVNQATLVPYRPNRLGLVERFHRTWKDMISLYVEEAQDDWDDFLPSALYAYNGSKHATHGYQPNELMMGRKLRTPAELLRRSRLVHPRSTLQEYHEVLMQDLKKARELAALALQKEQARQAMYYNQRNVRNRSEFRPGQLVWIYRHAGGPGITKFGHRWRGPGKIVEAAGYDNYRVLMMESGEELVTHCSFLLSYYYPNNLLDQMAKDIAHDLREKAIAAADLDSDNEDDTAPGLADLSEVENNLTVVPDLTAATELEGRTEADQTPTEQGEPAHRRERRAQGKRRRTDNPEAPDTAAPAEDSRTEDAEAPEQRVRRKRVRTVPAGSEDAIAGRTRAKVRRAPYAGTETDSTTSRDDSPTRARASRTALEATAERGDDLRVDDEADQPEAVRGQSRRPSAERRGDQQQRGGQPEDGHRNADHPANRRREAEAAANRDRSDGRRPDADQATEQKNEDNEEDPAEHGGATEPPASEADRETSRSRQEGGSTASRRVANEADEEEHVYVFAGRGRRGTDSLVSRQPRLTRIQPDEAVVECRRRRYRTRTGRYVLEFQVQRVGDRSHHGQPERLWINQRDYEQLWREGRMHSESYDSGDDDYSSDDSDDREAAIG